MQNKLLHDVVSDIAGKTGSDILELLVGKKHVNEFILAKKLKLTINQIRNILYKLSNYSLVSFTRKKDKRKGWYTYFWTLENEKVLELLSKKLEKEAEVLKNQLKSRKIKRFFECKTCKTEIGEENALLHNFTCQECGEVYELSDNHKILSDLEKQILKIELQRKSVLEELGKIKSEKQKKLIRKEKREIVKKKKERRRKFDLRRKDKKKLKKKKARKKSSKKKR